MSRPTLPATDMSPSTSARRPVQPPQRGAQRRSPRINLAGWINQVLDLYGVHPVAMPACVPLQVPLRERRRLSRDWSGVSAAQLAACLASARLQPAQHGEPGGLELALAPGGHRRVRPARR